MYMYMYILNGLLALHLIDNSQAGTPHRFHVLKDQDYLCNIKGVCST